MTKPPVPTTQLWANPYVHLVLEYMQTVVPPDQLCGVAESVNRVAPAIWGHHGQQRITPLVLFRSPAQEQKESSGNQPVENSSSTT